MENTLSNNNNQKFGSRESVGIANHHQEACESLDFCPSLDGPDCSGDCDLVGCASISNSYCIEWDRLFAQNDYLKKLKSVSMRGNLRSCRFRSICWKLFLEVLPENQSLWVAKTNEWRRQYEDLKNQLIVNPRNAEAKDLSINNPLSQEVESPWNQFFLDNELRLTIKQDVIRTFPEIAFFNDASVRDMLTSVLFCYARCHERVSYKQGMHELLAPLIFVLHCDHQAFLHACELESVRDITKHLLDPRFLEHDAYSLFNQIMETVEPWYVSKEIIPSMQRGGLLSSQPFSRPPEIHPSNVIVTKLTRIQDYLLKRFDAELHERLQSMDIVPQIYGIRWVRLLFGREFPMQDLLMLWDAIFADGISFDLVDYIFVAMLLYIKDALVTSDYASCLHLLMKYPPIADMQYFIDKALYLREPSLVPKPPDYQYQKPPNFGVNSWNNGTVLSATRVMPAKKTGGSLGSSVTQGLSSLRRPGSLTIGPMSKSTSEPMNLITDTAVSPMSATGEYAGDPFERKGSTASLSHIEGVLNQSARPIGLRTNSSSQSLVQVDSWRNTDPEPPPGPDATISPPTNKTGKFFVFGGTRSARKSASKQKQMKNGGDAEVGRAMISVSASESMCRRCAAELDVHIGTLQKHLLRHDQHTDDEVLLSLAGIKQVRDVLKGILKPSCLSDTDTESTGGGWHGYASTGVKRQVSDGSAHSSQSTTPIHDTRNRFYIATPDLLSSDTDVTSPEKLFLGAASGTVRNASSDTIVPAGVGGPPMSKEVELGDIIEIEHDRGACTAAVARRRSVEAAPSYRGRTEQLFSPLQACGGIGSNVGTPDGNGSHVASGRLASEGMLYGDPNHVSPCDLEKGTSLKDPCKPADAKQREVNGGRHRLDEAAPDMHQRDSSPINRLAGLFKNFAKF